MTAGPPVGAFPRSAIGRLWLRLHKAIGLGLFVLLIPLAASGALSALSPTIDHFAHPERRPHSKTPPAPSFSAYMEAANKAFGEDGTVTSLVMIPGSAVVAHGGVRPRLDEHAPIDRGPPRRLTAWIDPGSAKVLAFETRRGRGAGFMAEVRRFHERLILGNLGRKIVGAMGLLMLIEALTGLFLCWPPAAACWFGLRWRRGEAVANLHYVIGFWTCLPLAFLALTGMALSFPRATVEAISTVAPVQPLRPPGRTLFASRLNADQAATLALAGENGAQVQTLEAPTDSSPSWKFDLVGGGHAPVRLGVNDDTGAVRAIGERRSSLSNVIQSKIRELHTADGLGRGLRVWRWITVIAGFAPAILALTGLAMTLRKRPV